MYILVSSLIFDFRSLIRRMYIDYYELGPRTRAWHWSRCSALCPGCVDTAQAARRVTEARALNHSYQMLWYSDIGPRHSAITLSPGSANQRPGWPRSDQSESSTSSACDQIVVPGSYSLYPGRVKYQSSALTLCSISCPALHCSLLAYKTENVHRLSEGLMVRYGKMSDELDLSMRL